jgi:glycosyltransferase involved in cell wall biosynthesis
MRIAFVITCLGVGGAEKVVASLADALADRGHEILIVYLTGKALVKPANAGIRLVGLDVNSVSTMVAAYYRLRGLLKAFKPDVVHSHLVHANILTRLVRLSIRLPRVITTAHNKNEEGDLRMLAYRVTDHLADLSTNVSDEAVAAFIDQKAVKPGRMVTVHNGISTEEFQFNDGARSSLRRELGIADDCKLIVAVGRLSAPKDYPNLLDALALIDKQAPTYQVCIAGDGPLKTELMAMRDSYGLSDRVQFLGVRRDVSKLLSAADVFSLSSAWEGFPLVVGEAMASECIVVATDCGGVKEFVGDTGFLAPPQDPKELARMLEVALALGPEERRELGRAARARIKRLYSLEAAVEKWLGIYTSPKSSLAQRVLI